MTKEEIDQFLVSIGGLIQMGYKKNNIIESSNFFQCGDGWNLIIKRLIEDLIELGWDKKIIQIKEKFAGLRFYVETGSDEIHNRIRLAEEESYNTCEKCGEEGEKRVDLGWWSTLCEKHYNETKDAINNRNI